MSCTAATELSDSSFMLSASLLLLKEYELMKEFDRFFNNKKSVYIKTLKALKVVKTLDLGLRKNNSRSLL